MSHASDMINRIKFNRALLKSPGIRMREIRQVYLDAGIINYKSNKPAHRVLTDEERLKIRKKIIRAYQKEIWKKILALLIAFVITSGLLYLIFTKATLLSPYFSY